MDGEGKGKRNKEKFDDKSGVGVGGATVLSLASVV